MKNIDHIFQKGDYRLQMDTENALNEPGGVKHIVATNPWKVTTSKLPISSAEQKQIMDVLEEE